MSLTVLKISFSIAHIFLSLSMVLSVYRMIAGPKTQDRILGLDTFYINALLFIVIFAMRTNSMLYLEAALLIGLLGFTATVALAKFLMRGEVIE